MPDGIAGVGCWGGRGCDAALAGVSGVAFKRATDKVAGAKAHGESEREHDAAEEDAKGQPNDVAAHLEVVEDHGGGKHEYQPLDAERQEPRVLELLIDGSDEDRTGQETRDESAGDKQQGGPYDASKVGQKRARQHGGRRVGGVEG